MSETRLYIALPIYGNVDPFWHQCFTRLLTTDRPCAITVDDLIGDSAVQRARNVLTARFLKSNCTDLLFIDTDIIFSPAHVARLLSHDVDVVGGFYAKKQESEDIEWVCNCLDEPSPPRSDGLQRMKYMGTGFLRVRRGVIERMVEEYGKQAWYTPDSDQKAVEWDLWPMGVYEYKDGSRRFLSEDWYFCQRCLDMGLTVWGDTRIALKHSGAAIYPLKSQEKRWLKPNDNAPVATG